ncbi:hypothetical protein C5167_015788 [Papaver somniferum]|uniref:Uncharacterized protein n=1 Tax=Papaver somniferum TaxID=3469 RepID=A0A4Y7JB30_PAPSO|nr:hypothetical protein C5167_015788 [Papaver somniferum]
MPKRWCEPSPKRPWAKPWANSLVKQSVSKNRHMPFGPVGRIDPKPILVIADRGIQ